MVRALLATLLGCMASAASSPVFTATPSGSTSTLTLAVNVQPADADVGNAGAYYIAAVYKGTLLLNDGKAWSVYSGGDLPTFATGRLQKTTLTPIQNLNVAGLAGTQVLAGYGSSASDMLSHQKFATVYTVLATPKVVLGYFTGTDASMASATATTTPVTMVSMDQVDVQVDGSLVGTPSASLLASDQASGKGSFICISNYGATDFDANIAHGALVTNRTAFINNILSLVQLAHYTGVNIDFEGINASDRDAYSSFVAALATQLHAVNAQLMLSVPAKSQDDPSDSWTWPYNFSVLGQSADLIQVMTYDETIPTWAPGPVAGSDWMLAALQFASSQIPASKLLLGLPAYGYDWNKISNAGTSIAWKDIPALLASSGATPQWDATSNSPYFDYTAADGSPHEVWYENPQSIQLKAHFAQTLGLAGVSMWALGDEDANFWSAVTAGVTQP